MKDSLLIRNTGFIQILRSHITSLAKVVRRTKTATKKAKLLIGLLLLISENDRVKGQRHLKFSKLLLRMEVRSTLLLVGTSLRTCYNDLWFLSHKPLTESLQSNGKNIIFSFSLFFRIDLEACNLFNSSFVLECVPFWSSTLERYYYHPSQNKCVCT